MSIQPNPEDQTDLELTPAPGSSGKARLTRRQRRRRILLLTVLALLLALLAYSVYYFNANRRIPTLNLKTPTAALQAPRYLYSITGSGSSLLERPVGIGIANRRVYVVDFGKSRVSVFEEGGKFISSFNRVNGGATLRRPTGLAIHGNEVWVTDRLRREIYIFDLQGKFLRRFRPVGEKLDWGPLAIGFAADGRFVVTDVGQTRYHKVHFFSAEGSRTATIGRTAQANQVVDEAGGFLFPSSVAVDKDGNAYISDGDNRRIQVFGPDGQFSRFIDTSGVPRGSVIDSKDRLYVVDALAHNVDIYSLAGELLTQFGDQGFGPGQFNFPSYIALNGRGRIFVTDRENNQVQVWGWPTAELPSVPAPTTPLGWLLCLSPLVLLPLLLLLRKRRIVVTPDFVEALIESGDIEAVAGIRRLRLICPEQDHVFYAGRVEQDVDLGQLIQPEEHSESDVRALMEHLELEERHAVLISMAERVTALATEDRELRRTAVLAEVAVLDLADFEDRFLPDRIR